MQEREMTMPILVVGFFFLLNVTELCWLMSKFYCTQILYHTSGTSLSCTINCDIIENNFGITL